MPLYEFIVEHATLEPFTLEFQQVLAAMRGNQDAINRFFGVIQNTIPWAEFFSPENLSQIMGLTNLDEELGRSRLDAGYLARLWRISVKSSRSLLISEQERTEEVL